MNGPFTGGILSLNDEHFIRRLHAVGHFRNPLLVNETWDVSAADLPKLKITDKPVQFATASYQDFLSPEFNYLCLKIHGRVGQVDGSVGPATRALLGLSRCEVPDFKEAYNPDQIVGEATGSGNWKGCHGVGDFHCAVCQINDSGMSSHYKAVWADVLRVTQVCDAAKGLLWRFVDRNGKDVLTGDNLSGEHVDTQLSLVSQSSGWIGLAILGRGIQCSRQTIWLRLLSTYGASYAPTQRTWQIAELLVHELTHNKGYDHTRGGIMNPSIATVRNPPTWDGDPLDDAHDTAYGGKAAPIPGSGPPKKKQWTHLTLSDANYPADDLTLPLNPPWPRGSESRLDSLK